MTKEIYLEASGNTEQSRPPYTDDDWDRGDTTTSWDFGRAYLYPKPKYGSIAVDDTFSVGDEVHLVVAVWSTGDTFGNDAGACQEVISVHKSLQNAKEAEKLLSNASNDYVNRKPSLKLPDGYELRYIPWDGYFEGLDYITIETRTLKEGSTDD